VGQKAEQAGCAKRAGFEKEKENEMKTGWACQGDPAKCVWADAVENQGKTNGPLGRTGPKSDT
jgi:hypothetical protein